VIESRGLEFIALDLDPHRVRDARQAGDPVVYGDAAQPGVLRALGLERASVLVVSFSDPQVALGVVRSARGLRADLPILVRTEDDARLDELQAAGATEVIPATLETSLSLVAHVLLLLDVPAQDVLQTTEDIRHDRYAVLRNVFRRGDAPALGGERALRQQLRTVVLPPGARGVGRSLAELGLNRGPVRVTAVRREGIVGRDPTAEMRLREGDVVVLWGTPENLESAEVRLLMG
jgi:CPA2 family monovalent cation:H+ antiporter-2